jgi:hypothetical protein
MMSVHPPLWITTSFAGYEGDFYFDEWLEHYARMAEGVRGDASALWLNNSGLGNFSARLKRAKKSLPIPVRVLDLPLRIGDPSDPAGKNAQVCANAQFQLWSIHDPRADVLFIESDVLVHPEAPERLREDLLRCPGLAAVSGAVSEGGWMDNSGTMAWRFDVKRPQLYGVPEDGEIISWYNPEFTDGMEAVDAVPFGCLFAHMEIFTLIPPRDRRWPEVGWDQEWSMRAWELGRPVAVDWGVRCGHRRNLSQRTEWWKTMGRAS